MKCKGAIFDMDGLLFDTEQIFQNTWHEIAAECGLVLSKGFLEAISGTNGNHMCQVIEKYYHVSNGAGIMEECMKRIRKKLLLHVPVKKGVFEILSAFQEADIHMAVASSSSLEQIKANLHTAGIDNYFDILVSGSEVKHGKPEPDIFLCAANRLGMRPGECFVFEDSENGIISGHKAGCAAIMIPDLIEPSPQILPYCFRIYPDLLCASDGLRNLYM